MLQSEPCLRFGPWGVTELFWAKIIRFYGKITENWKKWLIDYLRFYVPLKNISLIWRRHHYRWRAAKFRPMLGAQGLWAGNDLYRATPAVTRDLGFSGPTVIIFFFSILKEILNSNIWVREWGSWNYPRPS
jgi:hypothetical protein